MFTTEHLQGRMLYETEKVVCINVYLKPQYAPTKDYYLCQVLISLVNTQYVSTDVELVLSNSDFLFLSQNVIRQEISEGVT